MGGHAGRAITDLTVRQLSYGSNLGDGRTETGIVTGQTQMPY